LKWTTKLKLFLQETVSSTKGVKDYAHEVIKYYIEHGKAPPNRATIYKHLLRYHPEAWIPPGLGILVTVLAINFIGDGLRDAFDPKSDGR